MHLKEMNDERVYEALHGVWDEYADRRPDELRDPNVLDYFLFQDGGATQLYVVDDTPAVVLVADVIPGLSATVMLINHDAAEPGEFLRELRRLMDELDLKRLTSRVPGPVKDVQATLKEVGFRREGHMRRATFLNNRLCGIDIYGMYKDAPRRERRPKVTPPRTESAPQQPRDEETVDPSTPA